MGRLYSHLREYYINDYVSCTAKHRAHKWHDTREGFYLGDDRKDVGQAAAHGDVRRDKAGSRRLPVQRKFTIDAQRWPISRTISGNLEST